MNKQHIPGFFDSLVRTPAFLFLCAMFLCGALAGGLTGLHASEGDSAVELTAMLSALPGQAVSSVLCAVLWLVLPLVCALLRPVSLCLSAVALAEEVVPSKNTSDMVVVEVDPALNTNVPADSGFVVIPVL